MSDQKIRELLGQMTPQEKNVLLEFLKSLEQSAPSRPGVGTSKEWFFRLPQVPVMVTPEQNIMALTAGKGLQMNNKEIITREKEEKIEECSIKMEKVRDLISLTSDFLESEDCVLHGREYDTLMIIALDYVLEVIEFFNSFECMKSSISTKAPAPERNS